MICKMEVKIFNWRWISEQDKHKIASKFGNILVFGLTIKESHAQRTNQSVVNMKLINNVYRYLIAQFVETAHKLASYTFEIDTQLL